MTSISFPSLVLALALALVAAPAEAADDLAAAARAAAELPRLHSLLVSSHGELVLEHYAGGVRANRPANIKSAAKSVISALVGIAIDRGLIKSVREPVLTFFPELARDGDPRKRAITLEDLLTMRSGLESTSGQNYGRWVTSANWVSHVLGRPLVAEPGASMQYSTGSSHLLSAIITKVSKTSTWQFAQRTLGEPLKTTLPRWTRDPQGIYFGGNEMLMTPRQMIAFGELYLNKGRAGGVQVVPSAWVDASCVPRTSSVFDPGRDYGYGWWIDEIGGRDACFAWGFGGQYIIVFRELQMVVAVTSSTTASDERWGYRRQLLGLIEQHVLPPGKQG
ncbi:MAG TPA: serine hydrolase [Vicinamibacterales bacterium]|nr:serine hydrolase [Vicinamibacterales bacterium]